MRSIVNTFTSQTGATYFHNTTYDHFLPSFPVPRHNIHCVPFPTSHHVPLFIHLLTHTFTPSRHSPPPFTPLFILTGTSSHTPHQPPHGNITVSDDFPRPPSWSPFPALAPLRVVYYVMHLLFALVTYPSKLELLHITFFKR
jgi:hypothetical protein